MRTTIELSKDGEQLNTKDQSVHTSRKPFINQTLSNTSESNAVNEDNIHQTNSLHLTLNAMKPSIGKWMYENDDYSNDIALDLTNKDHNSYSCLSTDNLFVMNGSNAGPSGLNSVFKSDKTIKTDCDLNKCETKPQLDLEDIELDDDIQQISDTINLSSDDDYDYSQVGDNEANDVEIIDVKIFSEPNLDDDIEVLSEILTAKEVIDLMKHNLERTQEVTKLSLTTIRILMTKYNWNKDFFANQVYELGINKILDHFKLVISYELKGNAKRLKSNADGALGQGVHNCLVCFDELNMSEMFGSKCGHYLCIDCWNQYISAKVNDSSSDEYVKCPGDKCELIVDDDDLIAIIEDKTVCHKFQRLISNSFVSNYPLLRWCPNGDCFHAVRVKHNGFQDIECICRTVFCFLCGDQWHEPLSCDQNKTWIQRYASQTVDPKSAKWLTKHTKFCPKCRFPIEKNGGCNYVMCSKCRHQFCYQCLGRCSHGRCLRENADDSVQAQANDNFIKLDLNNYPKIKDKYQKQLNQLSAVKKLQEGVNNKLEKAVKCPQFKSELKFLKNAFTVLCHCRQTLMYSYVFEYYLKGPEVIVKECNRHLNALESQTTLLWTSLLYETSVISKDIVFDMKRKVQSTYRECEAKRSAVVQHIRHGLRNNLFQFNPF